MLRTEAGTYVIENDFDVATLTDRVSKYGGFWEVGVDVETYPDNPKRKTPDAAHDHLVGVGVSFYEPMFYENKQLGVRYENKSDQRRVLTMYGQHVSHKGLVSPSYLRMLKWALSERTWYAHNGIFDAHILRRYGIILGPDSRDPRVLAYLLGQPEAGLKYLIGEYLPDYETTEYSEILARHDASDMRGVPLLAQADYCGTQDAELVVPLERVMREQVASVNPRALDVYEKVERFMVPILVDMSVHGIRYNREKAQPRLEEAIGNRDLLDSIIAPAVSATGFVQYETRGGEIWHPTCKSCRNGSKKRSGCISCGGKGKLPPVEKPFNSGSSDQVRAFIYDHLKLPMRRFTGDVKPWMIERGYVDPAELDGSTDALAMLQLQERHETIPLMLARRGWKKQAEFLTKWESLSERDGRLHTTFTNTTVASGRLSSRDPNLQQVTLKNRDLMEADEGYEIVAGDMQQLEIVIAAYMSRDPVLIDILRAGKSTHAVTAEAIFGIPYEKVEKSSPQYLIAKITNFLSNYGGKKDKLLEGIEKLALQRPELSLAIPSLAECDRFIWAHKKKYVRYWQWVSWTISRARELGYAETAFGRPRYFPDINSYDPEKRTEGERAAVNHAIQGSAADLMKMAMKKIADDEEMREWGYMVLQVHDEIVSVVQREHVVEYMDKMRWYMELGQPFEPVIGLGVDVSRGPNWGSTHK